jgi:hypothetical protein
VEAALHVELDAECFRDVHATAKKENMGIITNT